MSKIIKVGENRTEVYKAMKISGFQINAVLIANAVNVGLLTTDFTAKSIPLKVDLNRGGRVIPIMRDNLASLLAHSFGKAAFALLNPLNGTLTNIKLLHGAAVIEKAILPYRLDFGCPIDLDKNDELSINIDFQSGSQSGANLTGSTSSYIDIVEQVSTMEEFETPVIDVITLEAGITNFSRNLGNGVRKIVLLNYDKDSILNADRPVTNVSLTSDKLNYSLSGEQLMEHRLQNLNAYTDHAYHRQNLMLYNGSQRNLNNVQINMTTTAANVTAGNCVLVVWRREADAATIQRAAAKKIAHDKARARRHGFAV